MSARPAVRSQRGTQRVVVAMALGLTATCLFPSAFLMPPNANQQVASRRGALAAFTAAAAAALQMETEAPARAAAAPEKIEVSGIFGSRSSVNGVWNLVPGQQVNSRNVYKKEGDEIYLEFNDCGAFQFSDKITGTCDGFASETKGKWTVDGKEAPQVKIRPLKEKPKSTDGAPAPAPSSSDESEGGFSLVKLPQVGFTGKESDEDLLWGRASNGINVGNYIRAKGGEDFLQNAMTLDDQESEIASGLEARLGDIKFIPGGR